MARPVRTTPPSGQVVSVADAKKHLRVYHVDDDEMIATLVAAAEQELDGYAGLLGRCLLTQTWSVTFPNWAAFYRLPFPDVSAAVVTYTDPDGATQTVNAALYELIEEHRGTELWFRPAFTRPSLSSDTVMPVTVAITAGYGTPSAVPADLVNAIKARVSQQYWGTPSKDVDPTITNFLRKHRMVGV